MSVSGAGAPPRVITPAEVSLKQLVPGGRVNDAKAEFRASAGVGLGADVSHVRHAVANGLETVTFDVDIDWAAERLGGQDMKVKLSEKRDTDGKKTGVKGQLYVSIELYAQKDGKLIEKSDWKVSPAANGAVTLTKIGRRPQGLTLHNGALQVTGTPIGTLNGKLTPKS